MLFYDLSDRLLREESLGFHVDDFRIPRLICSLKTISIKKKPAKQTEKNETEETKETK